MYLIVGLGNPGKQYENTRHNVGFDAIDLLVDEYRVPSSGKQHKAMYGKGVIGGRKVILAKPLTYMNLSGESVRAMVDYYKIDPEQELIVVYDDISLEPGKIRIRKKEVPVAITGSKILSRSSVPRTSRESKLESEKSRRAGIWQIMCWDTFPKKTERWWMMHSSVPQKQWS